MYATCTYVSKSAWKASMLGGEFFRSVPYILNVSTTYMYYPKKKSEKALTNVNNLWLNEPQIFSKQV